MTGGDQRGGATVSGSLCESVEQRYNVWRALVVFVFALQGVVHIYWGELNADEGCYSYVATLAATGKLVYHDFHYTQAPLMPYVYGVVFKVFGPGLFVARFATFLCGLGALLLAMNAAERMKGRLAGFFCGLVFALNGDLNYNLVILKPYGAAALLIAFGAWSLTLQRSDHVRYSLAGAALALATALRLSVAPALVVLTLFILVRHRRKPMLAIIVALQCLGVLAAVFLPFVLPDPSVFYFCVFERHTHMSGTSASLANKAFLTKQIVEIYLFLAIGMASTVVGFIWSRRGDLLNALRQESVWVLHLLTFGAIFLVNFSSNNPIPPYHAIIAPLAAMIAGAGMAAGLGRIADGKCRDLFLIAICIAGTLCAFFRAANWFDPTFRKSDLRSINAAAEVVAEHARPGDAAWAFELNIPVKAGVRVPMEMSMGEYAFMVGAPAEWIDRYRLNDPAFHRNYITNDRPRFVILSEKLDLASEYYSVEPVDPTLRNELLGLIRERLDSDYTLLTDIDDLGWWQERVEVYMRKDEQSGEALTGEERSSGDAGELNRNATQTQQEQ